MGDTSCDDGIACTQDVCTSSGCSHAGITAGWCRIGGACYQNGAANPSNACQRCDAGASPSGWTNEPTTKACDDHNGCSPVSYCDGAGACVGDTSCSDGVSCTDDVCLHVFGSQVCVNPVSSGRCLIGGSCYYDGTTQPGNVCYACDPSGSGGTSDWSTNNGVSCTDGYGVCTVNYVCSNGTCQGTFVTDAYESNDSVGVARYLGSKDDDMNWPVSLSGNLWGPRDEDWYRYHVNDTFFGNARPRVQLSGMPAGNDYDLCVYLRCTGSSDPTPSVTCASGKHPSSYTIGGTSYPGCCSTLGGNATEEVYFGGGNYECSGSNDDYDAYVRVFRYSGAGTCESYTLDWGDD